MTQISKCVGFYIQFFFHFKTTFVAGTGTGHSGDKVKEIQHRLFYDNMT